LPRRSSSRFIGPSRLAKNQALIIGQAAFETPQDGFAGVMNVVDRIG
jgi:hypothetical protein